MKPIPVVLELPSGRARLEPLAPSHVSGLLEAAQDDRVWRYIPWFRPRTHEEMGKYVDAAIAAASDGGQVPFAIVDRATGKPAGSTRYLDIQQSNRALEIGFTWIGVPWQRTSVNTECKYLLMHNAFETLGATRVQLKTDARNEQSQKAILRIGAQFEGCLRKSRIMPDGFIRDTMCYSVIESEWPAVKERLEARLARE